MMTLLFGIALSVQNSSDPAYEAAFDKGFRITFREKSIEDCRASAKNAAAAKIDTTPICACVTDQLLATRTVPQLQGEISESDVTPIVAQCIVEHPPVAGSKAP